MRDRRGWNAKGRTSRASPHEIQAKGIIFEEPRTKCLNAKAFMASAGRQLDDRIVVEPEFEAVLVLKRFNEGFHLVGMSGPQS